MEKITALYERQEEALARMMAEPTKAVLLASEQDQGKTLISIEFALRMKFERVLFVGIKDTFEQFRQRTEAQSDGAQTIRRIDSSKPGKKAEADLLWGVEGWYFIGQQLFTSRDWEMVLQTDKAGNPIIDPKTEKPKKKARRLHFWDDIDVDCMIYDEVHMAANRGSNGAKTLHAAGVDGMWKVAMSGTFYGNKFDNAWAPTRWLWPDLIPRSYWLWRYEWCEQQDVRARGGKTVSTVIGPKPPADAFVKSLPCYIRHVGEDDVPDPEVIVVDLLPEQRRMYDALEEDLIVWKRGHPFVVDFPVTLKERLRTATLAEFDFDPETQEIWFPDNAESTKIDALFRKLAQFPLDRVILATHSKRFVKLVVKRMQARGMRVVEWSGDVSTKGREAIKAQWLAGEVQYIVCVINSFSTGLDWAQTGCWRIGWLSRMDGNTTANDQFVRRVFRTGPHKHKFAHFEIQGRDTHDQGVFANYELQHISQQEALTREPARA